MAKKTKKEYHGYVLVDHNEELCHFETLEECEDWLNTEIPYEELEFCQAFKLERVKIAKGKTKIVDLVLQKDMK